MLSETAKISRKGQPLNDRDKAESCPFGKKMSSLKRKEIRKKSCFC